MASTLDKIMIRIVDVCPICNGQPPTTNQDGYVSLNRCYRCLGSGKSSIDISLLDLKNLLDGYVQSS